MALKEVFAPHLNRNVKFGRTRPVARTPRLRLRDYLQASLAAPPGSTDYSAKALPSLNNIYQNDVLGCCVISSGYHVVGVETGNAGDLFVATTNSQNVVGTDITIDYGAIGGYVPNNPSTDNGCNEDTALNYWQQHGFRNGKKLLGSINVDPTNKTEIMQCLYLFENLILCLELPDTYVNPFPSANGFTWDTGTPDPNNGHSIMAYGYNSTGVLIDTWGLLGTMTWAAVAELCSASNGGSLNAVITDMQLAAGAAKAPNGVAWHDLVSDFDSLGGSVPVPPAPTPAPPVPTPPAPGTAPTLAQAEAAVTAAFNANHALLLRGQAISIANNALKPLWPAGK